MFNDGLEAEVMEAAQKTEKLGQGATPLRRQTEGDRVVRPGVEKAAGRFYSSFQCLKRLQESSRGTLDKGLE